MYSSNQPLLTQQKINDCNSVIQLIAYKKWVATLNSSEIWLRQVNQCIDDRITALQTPATTNFIMYISLDNFKHMRIIPSDEGLKIIRYQDPDNSVDFYALCDRWNLHMATLGCRASVEIENGDSYLNIPLPPMLQDTFLLYFSTQRKVLADDALRRQVKVFMKKVILDIPSFCLFTKMERTSTGLSLALDFKSPEEKAHFECYWSTREQFRNFCEAWNQYAQMIGGVRIDSSSSPTNRDAKVAIPLDPKKYPSLIDHIIRYFDEEKEFHRHKKRSHQHSTLTPNELKAAGDFCDNRERSDAKEQKEAKERESTKARFLQQEEKEIKLNVENQKKINDVIAALRTPTLQTSDSKHSQRRFDLTFDEDALDLYLDVIGDEWELESAEEEFKKAAEQDFSRRMGFR